jgi:hypothetical protein
MDKRKTIALVLVVLALVGFSFLVPKDTAAAPSLLQMTPGIDPMSVPTVEAPTPQPGTTTMDPSTMNMAGSCPMMGGSMTSMGTSTGMNGMDMSGTGVGMSGMGMSAMGMNGMSGMNGMNDMNMSGMNMGTMQGTSDVLLMNAQRNWFFSLNPWILLGWVVLFGLVVTLLVFGILVLVRQLRREKQPVTVRSE